MLNKVSGLAGALATLLAIVSGFVVIPGLDMTLTLVGLGVLAGIAATDEAMPRMGLAAIALPAAATALGAIPMAGAPVGAILGSFATVAAAVFGTGAIIRAVKRAIETVKGMAA